MRLRQLQVWQFRNLAEAWLAPDAALTVISGENGQGKTNLLEAVWMLSGAKSFRASREVELIQRGQGWARVVGEVETPQTTDHLEVSLRADATGRRVSRGGKKNGVDLGRAGNLAGQFPCVVFEPGHIQMISGPPEGRRRFLDAALCQLYPGYLEALRRYTRALLQKNSCLRQCKLSGQPPPHELLDSFDSQLCGYGARLAQKRRDYTAALAAAAAAQYSGISQGRETLTLQYCPGAPDPWQPDALADALAAGRPADLRAGFATVGVHRDDIAFLLDGSPAKLYASQGQRRSAVLAAKIAELELIGTITGQTPVLLLDDVLSELDAARQDYLLNRIQGKQVFITSCDAALFAKTGGKVVTVEGGRVWE